MGGRWYFSFWLDKPGGFNYYEGNKGYYEFTSDSKIINGYDDSLVPFDEVPVYSKNGIVYSKEANNELLRYEFHASFPYADTATNGFTGNMRGYANCLARNNDLITCSISGIYSIYPDNNVDFYKYLVRFKEDGTPYQEYDY